MLYQKQTIAGEKNSVSAVSDFQWVAMTFLEEDEEWLNLLTTHLFLPVIALVGILQVWLYFIFFSATLPHTNEYNGKIGKCKGYDCQALILLKPKISLSALEKHLHCLAGPFQVFGTLLRFHRIHFLIILVTLINPQKKMDLFCLSWNNDVLFKMASGTQRYGPQVCK